MTREGLYYKPRLSGDKEQHFADGSVVCDIYNSKGIVAYTVSELDALELCAAYNNVWDGNGREEHWEVGTHILTIIDDIFTVVGYLRIDGVKVGGPMPLAVVQHMVADHQRAHHTHPLIPQELAATNERILALEQELRLARERWNDCTYDAVMKCEAGKSILKELQQAQEERDRFDQQLRAGQRTR